jgi:hypothetical protein
VLLEGPSADGKRALKLALLELVARRRLAVVNVEEQKRFGRTKRTAVLRSTGSAGRLSGSLASGMGHFDRTPQHTYPDGTAGVPVADVARTIAKDGGLSGWVKRVVLPELQVRGLYEQQQRKFLGIFTRTSWERTPAGEQVRADLVRRTKEGERGFRDWVDTDPARALAFVGVAGSSLLLMDALHPDIRRLREQAASDSGVYFAAGDGDDAERDEEMADDVGVEGTGALDLGSFDFDLDLGSFDAIDSAFDAIDAGVDSGGNGGGGDGGGGGD